MTIFEIENFYLKKSNCIDYRLTQANIDLCYILSMASV